MEDDGGSCSPGRVGTIRVVEELVVEESALTIVERVVGKVERVETGRIVKAGPEPVLLVTEGDWT